MKKLIIIINLLCISIISGCFNDTIKQKVITDENYYELVELMENPVMDNEKLKYVIISNQSSENIISSSTFGTYNMLLLSNHKQYNYTVNDTTIYEKDSITGISTLYLENVNIASLDHFSEMILDTYTSEFSYYSMKDFIPLALELTKLNTFDYYLDSSLLEKKQYRISGSIDISLIDTQLEEILNSINCDYKSLAQNNKIEITLTFRTDTLNSYFKPEFNFSIFDTEIIKIT